jgi:hypothetical protein
VPLRIVLECARALPFDRLERALVKRLHHFEYGAAVAIPRGIALLRTYDSRAIADEVIALIGARPQDERERHWAALERVGRRQPDVKAALLAAKAAMTNVTNSVPARPPSVIAG